MSSVIEHIRGNEFNRPFGPCIDQCNVPLNLSTATDIIFAIKRRTTDLDKDALILASITDTDPITITKDNVTSIITVVIDSDAMDNVPVGIWSMALQIEYTNGRRIEVKLTKNRKEVKTITIVQDTIVGNEHPGS